MAKIGRNESCPCGSGRKYKHCCLPQRQAFQTVSPARNLKISLLAEIEKIQQAARSRRETVRELGVFIFFAGRDGDAWLLEITDSDAVQLANAGNPLDVPIEENPETLEINWSHTFELRQRQFFLTTYVDKQERCLDQVPTQRIKAAIRRIRKRYSTEQLKKVHISEGESQEAAG